MGNVLLFLLWMYLQEKEEEKEKVSGFGSFLCMNSSTSGLDWLDGQQAAKLEVLDHWELLQTLDGREQKRGQVTTKVIGNTCKVMEHGQETNKDSKWNQDHQR